MECVENAFQLISRLTCEIERESCPMESRLHPTYHPLELDFVQGFRNSYGDLTSIQIQVDARVLTLNPGQCFRGVPTESGKGSKYDLDVHVIREDQLTTVVPKADSGSSLIGKHLIPPATKE
jgi:hypothetical protein